MARSPVLPVVIRYSNNDQWLKNDSFLDTFTKRLNGPFIKYKVHVLPEMKPYEGESLDEFKERVRRAMEDVPLFIPTRNSLPYTGSRLLLTSSAMFIVPAVLCLMKGKIMYGIGMLITAINSVRYHMTGENNAKLVDMFTNFGLGLGYNIACIHQGLWMPVLMSVLALVGYKRSSGSYGVDHAMFVHFPVLIGFFMIALKAGMQR